MSAGPTIVGVIPARYGSTRLPGKSLVPLCGKPLVQWVYERAVRVPCLSNVLIATDDQRIAAAAGAFGAEVVMTRPDHPSGTDRIAEAVEGIDADIVVNIQGDEPLIDPDLVEDLAQTLAGDNRWDMATAASRLADSNDISNPAVVKVVMAATGAALYFSRSVIPYDREPGGTGEPSVYFRHVGVYAYRRPFLEKLVRTPPCQLEEAEKLEQLRALYIGGRIHVTVTEHQGIGVDTPEDVPKAEMALRHAGLT